MVYLIANESGQVKIGYTQVSAKSRLSSLQTGNPNKLRLVWETDGDKRTENILHSFLRHFKLSGEWFDITGCEHILNIDWVTIFLTAIQDKNIVDFGDFVVDMYIVAKYKLLYSQDILSDLDKLRKKNLLHKEKRCTYICRGRSVDYYQERFFSYGKNHYHESERDLANKFDVIYCKSKKE